MPEPHGSGRRKRYYKRHDGVPATDVSLSDGATVESVLADTGTAGEALAVGELVTVNAAGEYVKAAASYSGGLWDVVGVVVTAAALGATVTVRTVNCKLPIKFPLASIPVAGDNGKMVYLSIVAGETTITPPVGISDTVIFSVGTLRGADGVNQFPDVHFRPRYDNRTT